MNIIIIVGLFITFTIMSIVIYKKYSVNKFKPNEEYKASNEVGELILFYAAWCPHSQTTLKLWYEYKKKYDKKNISFTEVDCDKNTQLADSYNIDSYPTIILLTGGTKFIFDAQMDNATLTQFINTIMK
uniref:Thioredoxin domain-containing protein n=1 Tax=viral metagenome TaxID=1070528 RepID=A0A6C0EUF8_9ZZZZ